MEHGHPLSGRRARRPHGTHDSSKLLLAPRRHVLLDGVPAEHPLQRVDLAVWRVDFLDRPAHGDALAAVALAVLRDLEGVVFEGGPGQRSEQ